MTSAKALSDLGIDTLQNMSQAVETLSGGQRQAASVARAAAFGSKIIVLDEPVFDVADRIHVQRLGRCAGVVTPSSHWFRGS